MLDRTALAIALLRGLGHALRSWDMGFERVMDEVKRRSFLIGKRIRARTGNGPVEGMAQDLGSEGGLIVRCDDGTSVELASADEVRLS